MKPESKSDIKDERFRRAEVLPQFRKLASQSKENKKTKTKKKSDSRTDSGVDADPRFAAIHTDTRFSLKGDVGQSIDKYGRKSSQKKERTTDHNIKQDSSLSMSIGKDEEEEEQNASIHIQQYSVSRIAYLTALSRGELSLSSSSSDEDDSDTHSFDEHDADDKQDEEEIATSGDSEPEVGILDPSYHQQEPDDLELTYEPSRFLAICNMDWNTVRAVDLFVILSSFVPPGAVRSVRIYPSDFGIEHMKTDHEVGPQGIWKNDRNTNSYVTETETMHGDKEHDSDSDTPDTSNSDLDDEKNELLDTDLDHEKLRAYEASKLKYYFAIAEFTSTEAADIAYKELDGIEVGHSSATMDLRSILQSDLNPIVRNRNMKDEATNIPSKYVLPDFVVAALQQSSIKCTWDEGDKERERLLTAYGSRKNDWKDMEHDDIRAYLASDASSSDDDDDDNNNNDEKEDTSIPDHRKSNKGSKLRSLLGLDQETNGSVTSNEEKDDDSFFQHEDDTNEGSSHAYYDNLLEKGNNFNMDEDDDDGVDKEFKFIPGMHKLEDKIRNTIKERKALGYRDHEDLTPWEKYQLKRKEKRKAKKQQASERKEAFMQETRGKVGKSKTPDVTVAQPSSKSELDLLLAGDDDEEGEKDFDMRGIARLEKLKNKNLKGSRKRKEMERAEDVSGINFKIDASDNRFSSLLEGDDERFGIDVTDPHYKDTPAMREILAEQSKRRKDKRRKQEVPSKPVVGNINADSISKDSTSSGALALSSLVKSLKTKVASKTI